MKQVNFGGEKMNMAAWISDKNDWPFLFLLFSAPDGVIAPDLVSETPTSMKVMWKPVGRSNSVEEPQYTVQFRDLLLNGTTIYE